MTARPEHVTPRANVVEWTPDRAEQVALEAGLTALAPLHWKVITLYREELARTGLGPALERLASLCCLSAADLRALFPGDTERLLARIAGCPVDSGCVLPLRS
jgi:sulfur relay (sulfurtransferase) DsrC/TusE family protein